MDAPGKFPRLRHAGGTEIDDQRVRTEALAEAAFTEHDLFHDSRRREVNANDAVADFAREFRERSRGPHAERHGGGNRIFATVPYHDLRASGVQVARHRAAHVAQANEPDLV